MSNFDHRVLLGLLIELHPTPLAVGDLARALDGDHSAPRAEDALAAMERDGLANGLDRFPWRTRARVPADDLAPV